LIPEPLAELAITPDLTTATIPAAGGGTAAGRARAAGSLVGGVRALDEDTLTRRRRVLGDDAPDTLTSASQVANDLLGLGDYLKRGSSRKRCRVNSADLLSLGEYQSAWQLQNEPGR
jgi:hypothetical protein